MTHSKKIIVAPLNWGLGHAARCIPIIKSLIRENFLPVIAGDGGSLSFLKKEFPTLETIDLPSYKISYRKNLKWNLLKKYPSIQKATKKEYKIINEYVDTHPEVMGIISDNRFGVRSKKVPSVYMTHQVNVLAGIFTPITSWVHQQIIKKFDECWIPDERDSKFSGRLSKSSGKLNQKFIGVLSRFEKQNLEKEIDILIVLSGPEPNRTELENKITAKFYGTELNVCLVQGTVEAEQKTSIHGKFTVINYVLSEKLELLLNSSKYVICRSGYSSIMDLVSMGKQALLIPTKHQSEQEYLARYHQKNGLFQVVKETELKDKKIYWELGASPKYYVKQLFDPNLFRLFQGE
jgi:uncharacterized protein (TIGR00661 family)